MTAATWEPGDPLHPRPPGGHGSQFIRRMVGLVEDKTPNIPAHRYCADCQVGWGEQETTCWVCGRDPRQIRGGVVVHIAGNETRNCEDEG